MSLQVSKFDSKNRQHISCAQQTNSAPVINLADCTRRSVTPLENAYDQCMNSLTLAQIGCTNDASAVDALYKEDMTQYYNDVTSFNAGMDLSTSVQFLSCEMRCFGSMGRPARRAKRDMLGQFDDYMQLGMATHRCSRQANNCKPATECATELDAMWKAMNACFNQ